MHKVDPETLETKDKVCAGGIRENSALPKSVSTDAKSVSTDAAEPHLAGSRGIPLPKEFVCACSISLLSPCAAARQPSGVEVQRLPGWAQLSVLPCSPCSPGLVCTS